MSLAEIDNSVTILDVLPWLRHVMDERRMILQLTIIYSTLRADSQIKNSILYTT